MRKERGLFETYKDPERADVVLESRRGFLNGAGWTAMALAVGAHIPFGRFMPEGFMPAALAQRSSPILPPGKDLVLLNERPLGAEARTHDLDDVVTPTRYHYIRNNGNLSPMAESMNSTGYRLVIDGEVERPLELSLDDLKRNYPIRNWKLQLECTGNGRAGYEPHPSGMQWTFGAIACSEWTGVSLADVLRTAGLKQSAVYTGHHSDDVHVSGNPDLAPLSRGIPIYKATNPFTILAWEMNGEPLRAVHGFPLRLVVPGWPGSASAKWLSRIEIRDRVHDGRGMTGYSYRINRYPVAPGADVLESEMDIIDYMPVKSIITRPAARAEIALGEPLRVRGHAWAGDLEVARVDISYDFGQSWRQTRLDTPVNPYAWQRWETEVQMPERGYYEIWARATDTNGKSQPQVVPGWNPRGYLNNVTHRIGITVV